jgi:threonine aldolase
MPPQLVDLRSDTVTLPDEAMRAAMASAPVGDDFYREDPTVAALEHLAAETLDKEAGLYVPSGTMGNLLAHLTHCPGGAEVIGPEPAHSFTSETGGPSRVAGMTIRGVPQPTGSLDIDRIAGLVRPAQGSVLAQRTGLLWVEQPTRGYVVPLADLDALRRIGNERGVPIHMDGARIFNAAVALGTPVARVARAADSVMFCVSKGLGAPLGSLLVGSRSFIAQARQNRQMLGGGLRQAGIVAAAGIYALTHNVARLADDHASARRLAQALAGLPGLRLDRETVETNIFTIETTDPEFSVQQFAEALRARNVLVNVPAAGRRGVRFVTHIGIESADIDRAIEAARDAVAVARPAVVES